MAWAKGQKLQEGKYIIEGELGRGGCGTTYLARMQNGELVAIKTPHQTTQYSSKSEKLLQDFLEEAKQLQKFRHPHIVQFYEVFQEESLWCIVMEYIPGETLASIVDKGGAMPEAEALRYIRQIGAALIEVHNEGLLHRDVNPRNIIVRSNTCEAVLIDFGIARKFTPDKTQSYTAGFCPNYAPIEQYRTQYRAGGYTDLYGLAATLYFLLTGEAPVSAFDRDDEIRKGKKDPLVPPKQLNPVISDRVNKAILKGMAFDQSDRPERISIWIRLLLPEVGTPPQVASVYKLEVLHPQPEPQLMLQTNLEAIRTPPQPSTSSNIPERTIDIRWLTIPWGWLIGTFLSHIFNGWLVARYVSQIDRWSMAAWFVILGGVIFSAWKTPSSSKESENGDTSGCAGCVPTLILFFICFSAINNWYYAFLRNAGITDGWLDNLLRGFAFIVAGLLSCSLSGSVLWIFHVFISKARKSLVTEFSELNTFIILTWTSLTGLGVGWLLYRYVLFS